MTEKQKTHHIKTVHDLAQAITPDNAEIMIIDLCKLLTTVVQIKMAEFSQHEKAEAIRQLCEFDWIDDGHNDVTLSAVGSNVSFKIQPKR